ncbi:hypothetical protein K2224_37790 (plasmid) [Streptomyces sp. BHT-5-2]|uniref:hypothetical protein n=1 Tax=unclassified Streptomyces TaxID=2593676 RepID=UPI001C8DBDAC|nr:hypothetical protein [Streptomyces sp. BHT-5-2]QZL08785.1 hypothetical protein K2224_37790 [Streptomyces sp. BHT-5-2]
MKVSDIEGLRPHLTSAFMGVTAASVALSGSLSRGDARIAEARVLSDLDLIPVVEQADDVTRARKQLQPVLQDLADHYAVTCTAAVTLRENFLRARHSGYVTSMLAQPFLCDPLGIQLDLEALPAPPGDNVTDVLPWLAQPVTYYLAKAGANTSEENLAKAATAARRLIAAGAPGAESKLLVSSTPAHREADSRFDVRPLAEECLHAVLTVAEEHDLTLLPSSLEFIAGISRSACPDETFHAVRDRTFLENQGLPFALSAMSARPSA